MCYDNYLLITLIHEKWSLLSKSQKANSKTYLVSSFLSYFGQVLNLTNLAESLRWYILNLKSAILKY